jgi:large repetitive protein
MKTKLPIPSFIQYSCMLLLMMYFSTGQIFATEIELNFDNTANCNAGADNTSTEFCFSEAQAKFKNLNDVKAFYLSLLEQGVPQNGTFNPNLQLIATNYSKNPYQTFKTTYTITDGNCTDSTVLAVTVVKNPDAGADNTSNSFCSNEVNQKMQSSKEAKNLFLSLLESNINTSGTFNPTIDQIIESYQNNPTGTFQTEYTVKNGKACSDSATLAITVTKSGNAGADNVNNFMCLSESKAKFTSIDAAREYYLSLLDSGIDRTGTFNPNMNVIASNYSKNPIGTFKTTYTVGGNGCQDSAVLSLTISEDVNAGVDNKNNILCYSTAESNMSSSQMATNYFMSLLDKNAKTGGTFNPSMEQLVSQFNQNPIGTFSTKYTVSNNACSDSADLAFTVNQSSYAGRDNTSNVMTRTEANNRFKSLNDVKAYYLSLLSPGVSQDGTFNNKNLQLLATQYSQNPIGTFKTVYSVTSGECTDSAILSLSIVEDQKSQSTASSSKNMINSNSKGTLMVYDLSGNRIQSTSQDAVKIFNTNKSHFSNQNLKSGIYIYKLTTDNGSISTKKIIVE